jgi:glutaredoxin-like protein
LIPLREQEAIRLRFAQELGSRVRIDYFSQRQTRVIVPGREPCAHCEDVRVILSEISHLTNRIALTVHELHDEPKLASELGVDKVPGIAMRGVANRTVRYSGIPMGAQFPVLLDTIIDASRPAPELRPETVRQLKKLKDDVDLKVFVTPTCRHSQPMARLALKLGLFSPRIKVEVIEITEYPPLAQQLGIQMTPATIVNGSMMIGGAIAEAALVQAIFKVLDGRPIAPDEIKGGPATAFHPPQPQDEQRQPTTTASGLIIPR